MKKNNLLHRSTFLSLIGLLFVPVCLFGGDQLPHGKNNRVYAKWEWQDASLQSVMTHLSSVSGVDIVVADPKTAQEKISISLRDRTWQDVVRIICQTKGLCYNVVDNNYILVANEIDWNNRKAQEAQAVELEKFTVRLKNTTAKEMQTAVQGFLSSSRAKAIVVEHNNSLIIHEIPKEIEKLKAFIEEMDQEVLQISISAKIVEVSSGYQNGIGIQWDFVGTADNEAKKGRKVKYDAWEATHLPTEKSDDGKVAPIIESAFEKVTFGILDPLQFSVALEYLFTERNSEVIAEPQIITLENKEAKIYMKSDVPILAGFDINGNQLVQNKSVGTTLTVTPTVTGQGHIKMALEPVKESYELGGGVGGTITHSQGAKTNVVVKDGETIVIAGLTSDDRQESESGIPFLKDIPILGYLFKKHSKTNTKRDLVIFVTPHIIKTTGLDLLAAAEANKGAKPQIQPEPKFIAE